MHPTSAVRPRRAAVTLALACIVALPVAACSKSSSSAGKASYEKSTVSIVKQRAKTEQAASDVACQADYDVLKTAIQTYELAEQSEPAKVADLVPNYLRDAPAEWQLKPGADGKPTIVPSAAGVKAGCQVPSG